MRSTLFLVFFLLTKVLLSQTGGISAYSIVDLETSPRTVAMGGSAISIYDSDILLSQKIIK